MAVGSRRVNLGLLLRIVPDALLQYHDADSSISISTVCAAKHVVTIRSSIVFEAHVFTAAAAAGAIPFSTLAGDTVSGAHAATSAATAAGHEQAASSTAAIVRVPRE